MGDSLYYYLDDSNTPQGPFTVQQMAALMMSGTVTQETRVAAAGDSDWKPAGEQAWMKDGQSEEAESMPGGFARGGVGVEPGNCPKCGEALTGWSVPDKCAACGYRMRPASNGFWANMLFAGRRLFSARGRATRKEYWACQVGLLPFACLWCILLVVGMGFIFVEGYKVTVDIADLGSALTSVFIFSSIMYVVFMLPYLFIGIRRLHDLGRSGWWVGLITAVGLLSIISSYPVYNQLTEESLKQISIIEAKYDNRVEQISQAHEEEYMAAVQRGDMEAAEQVSKEIQEEIKEAHKQKDKDIDKAELSMYLNLYKQSPHWLIISGVFSILSSVGSLMWLVIGFIDSKRGPNKYGPSIKYPRG